MMAELPLDQMMAEFRHNGYIMTIIHYIKMIFYAERERVAKDAVYYNLLNMYAHNNSKVIESERHQKHTYEKLSTTCDTYFIEQRKYGMVPTKPEDYTYMQAKMMEHKNLTAQLEEIKKTYDANVEEFKNALSIFQSKKNYAYIKLIVLILQNSELPTYVQKKAEWAFALEFNALCAEYNVQSIEKQLVNEIKEWCVELLSAKKEKYRAIAETTRRVADNAIVVACEADKIAFPHETCARDEQFERIKVRNIALNLLNEEIAITNAIINFISEHCEKQTQYLNALDSVFDCTNEVIKILEAQTATYTNIRRS
jgi:hypothetical protein